MAKLIIARSFRYSHNGYSFVEYAEGSQVETEDAEFVRVATGEGWAKEATAPRAKKDKGAAPENKAQ